VTAQVRIGLVGCGRVAELAYLPALRAAPSVRLASVADPVIARCRACAPGIPAYESAAALVAAGGVDAVVAATPAATHLAVAAAAAAADLPALVEKPPAPDAAGAAALAALEPSPWIGFNRRFDPALQRLRARMPADGEFELELDSHHPGGWASHEVDDDTLLGNGSHLIDLARWLSGSEVARVRATTVRHDVADLELELERGRARVSCGWGRPHRERVEVRSPQRSRIAPYVGDSPIRSMLRRIVPSGRPSKLARLLASELEELASAVRGEPAPTLATARDGAAVMAAIDAARHSAESGGRWLDAGPAHPPTPSHAAPPPEPPSPAAPRR
jgi:predicted dehydrogenase